MPLRPGVPVPANVKTVEQLRPMEVNYSRLGSRLEQLSGGFLKEMARPFQ
jgi:hypothetical protein